MSAAPSPRRRADRQGGHPGDLGDVADPHRHAAGQRRPRSAVSASARDPPAVGDAGPAPRPARPRSSSADRGVPLGRAGLAPARCRRAAKPTAATARRAATSAAKPGDGRVEDPHRYVGAASPGRAARPGRAPSAAPRSTASPAERATASRSGVVSCTHSNASGRPSSRCRRPDGGDVGQRRRRRRRRAGAGRRTASRRRRGRRAPVRRTPRRGRRRGAPRRRSVPAGRRRQCVSEIHRARLHVPDSGSVINPHWPCAVRPNVDSRDPAGPTSSRP